MKQFYFILLSTFVIGFFSGVYAYFISRPAEPVFEFNDRYDIETNGFTIIADMYGGCQMLSTCPSYRITDDGGYIYLLPQREEDNIQREGALGAAELDELKETLRATDLEAIEASAFSGTCPIAVDGVAFRYDIRIGETEYRIDTCENDAEDIPLFTLLEEYFTQFREDES